MLIFELKNTAASSYTNLANGPSIT